MLSVLWNAYAIYVHKIPLWYFLSVYTFTICLQKNWEVLLVFCSVYELSYLCLICVQSCTFSFLFYHGTFHYFHFAQMSKNLFLFKFVFYRTGDFSGLIMDDIWNHWENSGEFHRFCNLQFQVLAYLLQVLSSMFVCNY